MRWGRTGRQDPHRLGQVRGWEWLFPLSLAILLLILAWEPYRVAYRRASSSEQFMGLVGEDPIDDQNVYLALMRQAAEGQLLFTNNFTPEPNPPRLFNLLYLALGRLAGLTGWSLDFTHRVFGAVSIVLLVLAVYSFIATAIRKPWYRRLALLLACFGTGFMWACRLVLRFTGLRVRTVDDWLVEMSIFHTMLVYPHFVFAGALLIGSLVLLLKAERTRRFTPALAAGLCAGVLAVSHAFEVVALLPIAAAYFLLDGMGRGRIPASNRWKCLALVIGIPIPVLALNAWILAREPMWRHAVANLKFHTPDPFNLILGLGATFFIAALTFDGFLRPDQTPGERMAKAWLGVVFILAYVPWINWRYHLLNAVQVPLAILATQGLRRTAIRSLLERYRRRRLGRPAAMSLHGRLAPAALALLVFGVASSSDAHFFLRYRYQAGHKGAPTFLPKSEVAALEWMNREVSRDALVLSSYQTGNYIPRVSGQRVFVGEDNLTNNETERSAEVADFFGGTWTDTRRLELLRHFGVNYVFHGPDERRLGSYDPSRASFLRPVYEKGGVRIFSVEGTERRDTRATAPVYAGQGAP